MTTPKTLVSKLASIAKDAASDAFIICYAADPDMGSGLNPLVGTYPNVQAYYNSLSEMVRQAQIDIMLTSVSTMDVLARQQRLFDASPVTPAVRMNDTTDIWGLRGGRYKAQPSRPFATTTITEARFGTLLPSPQQLPDLNLGLYSLTFNNDIEADCLSLERFKAFRLEAAQAGFDYFVEIFNPNVASCGLAPDEVGPFVNDHIARMMAGIPALSRPKFLKVAYNGPQALEELTTYSSLVIGVLGGPASTTYDAYKLIAEVKRYGGRVALFGRRIKETEAPDIFVAWLRRVADDLISPEEAVKAYRSALKEAGITPARSLEDDMVIHTDALKL